MQLFYYDKKYYISCFLQNNIKSKIKNNRGIIWFDDSSIWSYIYSEFMVARTYQKFKQNLGVGWWNTLLLNIYSFITV